jgi:ABC-type transporter Mla subunit MlaD
MADKTLTLGAVAVTVPESLVPPEEAGSLSPLALSRIARAPRAVGVLCESAADGLERAGKAFQPPPGVTAALLREAGQRADGIDVIIQDLEVVLNRFKQANLLFDSEAYRLVRQVNDQVRAQAKHSPELARMFAPLLQAFATLRSRKDEEEPTPTPPAPTP